MALISASLDVRPRLLLLMGSHAQISTPAMRCMNYTKSHVVVTGGADIDDYLADNAYFTDLALHEDTGQYPCHTNTRSFF